MSTFVARDPYSEDELRRFYPEGLRLHLVQVLLRHGERTPVRARFKNVGLPTYWPYCNAARQLTSAAMTRADDWSAWDRLQWRRRIETFGDDDGPVIATTARGEHDGVCQLGELTDQGRATTLALGQRLRHLYVDQLKFMPRLISDADMIYLRATPMPRALESMQQAFWGMYPLTARTAAFPPPTIITRTPAEETLYPNETNCLRFRQLSRAFARRAADRWNHTEEMDYLNKLIGKWMPAESPRLAIDSHPGLSGVHDTVNSTLAHGPDVRLPSAFYDRKGREIMSKMACDEWFAGYRESQEYRQVGIGALVGDIVGRMVDSVDQPGNENRTGLGDKNEMIDMSGDDKKGIRFGLSGCHDTTLAAFMASFGAFDGEGWPPFTSHVAIELFRKIRDQPDANLHAEHDKGAKPSIFSRLTGSPRNGIQSGKKDEKVSTRKISHMLSEQEKKALDGYYVRVRYNDRPITIPGCKAVGNHLEGDESFCTLEAFKRIADKFTPQNWKIACTSNLDQPAFPEQAEPAGH